MSKSISMFDIEVQVLKILSNVAQLDKLVNEAITKDSLSLDEKYESIASIDKLSDRILDISLNLEESYEVKNDAEA